MRAEIISVGTELLLGFIVDTNASYLAQQLATIGIDLYYVSTFGDNLERVAEGVRRAKERSDLVIFTGGLGPTEDDLTREAIALALGETLYIDEQLKEMQSTFWRRRNLAMPPRNVQQAQLIPSAQPLPNPVGTAPGWWVEKDNTIMVAMPGVPREMTKMWEEQAVPRLREKGAAGVILTRTLKILGKGESAVEHDVKDFLKSKNPTIATYAKNDGVHLRLSAKADSLEVAQSLLVPFEAEVSKIVGQDVFAYDDDTLGIVLGRLVGDRRFAIADSLTAGGLAFALCDTPVMASRFTGGLVSATSCGVEWAAAAGKVGSEAAARNLARLARERFGADIGIGLTGAALPEDGEVGTFAVAVDDGAPVSQALFRASTPAEVRRWAAYTSLNVIWRKLADRPL